MNLSKEIKQLDNSKIIKDTNLITPNISQQPILDNSNLTYKPITKNQNPIIEKQIDNFIIPPVTQAYDINADINQMTEVGSGWLMSDGKEDVKIKNPLIRTSDKQNSLIPLRADSTLKQDLVEFRKNFKM